ncbi:MAG: DUF3144 domain-containing protein [Cocleimonas sp.]|nr:DUF3144 domain-containing protein [Cocleimonas sp.]
MSETKTDVDTDKKFKEIADACIDVGNQYLDDNNIDLVGSSLIYGAARFSSYIVASGSSNLEAYKGNREGAIKHFTLQFQQMLEENLTMYESVFKEDKKYEQYMKKEDSND